MSRNSSIVTLTKFLGSYILLLQNTLFKHNGLWTYVILHVAGSNFVIKFDNGILTSVPCMRLIIGCREHV